MPRAIILFVFIAAAMSLASGQAFAQQIQGQVRYADSNQTVIGALVHCDGIGGISDQLTDRNGKFFFRVSPGHYTVSVRKPGFIEEFQNRDMTDTRQSEYLFFTLKPERPAETVSRRAPAVLSANIPAAALKEFEKAGPLLGSGNRKKISAGIEHLERAIGLAPAFLEAHLELGAAYIDLQRWTDAEAEMKRVLEIDPKTTTALMGLGEAYWHQQRYSEAEKVLLAGLAIDNRSWRGHFNLGRVYWRQGEANKAGRQVALAIQLNPKFADAHLLAGDILMQAGKRQDALDQYREYLRLNPRGENARRLRAILNS